MEEDKMRKNTLTAIISAGVIGLVSALGSIPGWKNPETPAGHEGYVVSRPWLFGEGGYVSTMEGPQKLGLSWTKYVTNVDIRPQPHTEPFKIRMKDNLNVNFEVTLKAAPVKGESKDLIERIGENWYERFVKPEFQTICRRTIAKYESEGAPQLREKMAEEIRYGFDEEVNGEVKHYNGIEDVVKGNHIQVYSVVIGNIDYPKVVDDEIERKLATKQELEKKATQLEIMKREAEIRVAEAEGIAKSQEIINKTLTPEYLQHEAIGAAKDLANSPNTTFYFVPTNANGMGMPLVLNTPQDTTQNPEK
jgi:regulator of protease activity HflC (stomatin/prohibitin superfamily)